MSGVLEPAIASPGGLLHRGVPVHLDAAGELHVVPPPRAAAVRCGGKSGLGGTSVALGGSEYAHGIRRPWSCWDRDSSPQSLSAGTRRLGRSPRVWNRSSNAAPRSSPVADFLEKTE